MEWYVVHTKVNKEFVSEKNLQRQGVRTYLPKYKKIVSHARKKNIVTKPLFPRYMFIKFNLNTHNWSFINNTFGVSKIITMNDTPVKISEKFISNIKSNEDIEGLVNTIALSSKNIGEEVEILDGIFKGYIGVFQGLTKDNRANILLNLLGKEIALSMRTLDLA